MMNIKEKIIMIFHFKTTFTDNKNKFSKTFKLICIVRGPKAQNYSDKRKNYKNLCNKELINWQESKSYRIWYLLQKIHLIFD